MIEQCRASARVPRLLFCFSGAHLSEPPATPKRPVFRSPGSALVAQQKRGQANNRQDP
jgi:hypothetical protein